MVLETKVDKNYSNIDSMLVIALKAHVLLPKKKQINQKQGL